MGENIKVTGTAEFRAHLDFVMIAVKAANREIVVAAQTLAEATAKKQFTQSHSRGTATNSDAGSPPSVVTGTLRRSIQRGTPEEIAGGWRGSVFPSVVYALIQELGGATGRGGSTILPARPYIGPTHHEVTPKVRALAIKAWDRATHQK
jgi:phage gpG-like protein